ncbi:30S ribosomal protein S4 [bacterium HR11]|nr:30S ribosomal protein S4 [bacterium HR11]
MKLFLKGIKCYTKCPLERKNYPPGMHGRTRHPRLTPYGMQLREKQKVKRIYGVLERQFELYFERALRLRGPTGENLLRLLEKRLDNVIYRAGLAHSRAHARQLVRHGHVLVDGRKVDIPSYEVAVGQEIQLTEAARQNPMVQQAIEFAASHRPVPAWLSAHREEGRVRVVAEPRREDIDFTVQEHMIVELYSK